MFKKNKLSFILSVMLITLVLFGCTGENKITEEYIDEALDAANKQLSEVFSIKSIEAEDDIVPEEKQGEASKENNTLDKSKKIKAHFIDVGQGNATFIVSPDGKTMLYDAGGENAGSGRIVVDYIKELGYDHIDVTVFTHPHADHINGAATVFEELEVGSVYYPKVTHTTRTFENFVEAVSNAGLKFKTAKAGVEIPFGDAKATLVAPISDKYQNLNDYSATVKLTWGDTSVLLTGDVEKTSENEMINSSQDLDVDLLLVPHHGSNSSTTDEFLDKTTPDYAVISSGKDNSYGHPHKEVIERLNERNINIYNTAEKGTIIAELDGQKVNIKNNLD